MVLVTTRILYKWSERGDHEMDYTMVFRYNEMKPFEVCVDIDKDLVTGLVERRQLRLS